MPTYQYACTACGHQLEAVQSFADEPLTECPACEGRLRKLFSGIGVVFKGSGFYRTDSRTDSRAASSAGDKQASTSSGSSSSSDGSSKPADSKTESKAESKSSTSSASTASAAA